MLLEAESNLKLGVLSLFGAGRVFLSDRQVIWLRRGPEWTRMPWVPIEVIIPLSEIQRVGRVHELGRSWLSIATEGRTYQLVVGVGPYPLLRRTPETCDLWYSKLQQLRPGPDEPEQGQAH